MHVAVAEEVFSEPGAVAVMSMSMYRGAKSVISSRQGKYSYNRQILCCDESQILLQILDANTWPGGIYSEILSSA